MIISEIKIPSIKEYNILEIDEKFAKLSDYDFKCKSQYYKQGIAGVPKNCYIRKSVKDKLIIAQDGLPKRYKLLIFDDWRPMCATKIMELL